MKNEEIVRALRCVSTAGGENACEHCSYWKEEEVPEEERPIYRADTMHSCDVDRVGLDGADLIERLTARCARYAEEIAVAQELMRLADLESICSYTRLRELAEADKDGRLVVLPCKVGDGLWTFCSHPVEQVYSFTVTDISTLNGRTMLNTSRCGVIDARDVGKTVFLTREEAEKALEAMKDE